jgi:hypothetical protein
MINSSQSLNLSPSIQHFLNPKNLSMLWEVLLDELHINSLNSGPIIQNIKTVFDGNVNLFKVRANPNMGLMNLNKQFLNQLLIAVNQLFPNLKQEQLQQQQLKKINISDEVLTIDEPYKVEDIHTMRQNDFEKQLTSKRAEFENSINGKKPKPIDFSDKTEPELKITEMEALIAETMAKRKFDIEQIQGQKEQKEQIQNTSPVKKSVSFNDNITQIEDYSDTNTNINREDNEENISNINNIFSKLKKNQSKTEPVNQIQQVNQIQISVLEEQIYILSNKIDTLTIMMKQIVDKLVLNN